MTNTWELGQYFCILYSIFQPTVALVPNVIRYIVAHFISLKKQKIGNRTTQWSSLSLLKILLFDIFSYFTLELVVTRQIEAHYTMSHDPHNCILVARPQSQIGRIIVVP